jgi:hypothetical protein
MFFADRLTLDKPRRTDDGYMAVHAKAARTGIYQYLGREIDPEGKHFTADQVVNVYRPPEEVFDKASLGSFVGKPITDDHPSEGVNASNWRDLARGTIMGAARDGEHVGFDLAFLDASLIGKIDDGKRELSNGYEANISIEDGTAPDGTEYHAVQRQIRGNHVAVVDAGRAGESCRIGDAAACTPIPSDEVKKLLVDQRTYDANRESDKTRHNDDAPTGVNQVPKLILVDGLQVDVSNPDIAEATITKLIADRNAANDAKAKAEGDIVTLTAEKAKLTADSKELETKLADAKITPAMLRDEAKRYADVVGKAKALGVAHADDADAPTIMRAVVDAKLGDAAKDYSDDHVGIAFAALTKDAKPAADEAKGGDKIIDAIGGGLRPTGDAKTGLQDARRAKLARQENAYLGQQPGEARN